MKIVNVEFFAPNIIRYCVIIVWREKWRHFHPRHSRGNVHESVVFYSNREQKTIVADSYRQLDEQSKCRRLFYFKN